MSDQGFVVDTPNGIFFFQLASLKAQVRLENLGMKSRGKSRTAIAKRLFGLPPNTKRDTVISYLQDAMNVLQANKDQHPKDLFGCEVNPVTGGGW